MQVVLLPTGVSVQPRLKASFKLEGDSSIWESKVELNFVQLLLGESKLITALSGVTPAIHTLVLVKWVFDTLLVYADRDFGPERVHYFKNHR